MKISTQRYHRNVTRLFLAAILSLTALAYAQTVPETQPAPATPQASIGQIKKKIILNKKGIAAIQKKLKEEKKKQQQVKVKERSVLLQLQKVDQDLARLRRLKETNQQYLGETRGQISRLQTNISQNQYELGVSRNLLKERLNALYRMSFHSPYLGGLLSSESFGDLARKLKFELLLAESNEKLLGQTLGHEQGLERDSEEWEQEEGRRKKIMGALVRQEKNYSTKKRNRTQFLSSIQKQKALHEQAIRELSERSKGLQEKVSLFLKEAKEARKPVVFTQPAGGFTVHRGRIPWPVDGRIPPEYRFGKVKNTEFKQVVDNTGVQIMAPMGSPFRAVAAGLVRYADWFKGYGKLVILDHGGGYYSLYGQASELSVSEGQAVAAGEVLGAVGDTGSLVGSSLYFEIRKDGIPLNPERWLKRHL